MTPRLSVKDYIRTIPDFPHQGIMFRDVTTLFLDPRGFRIAVDQLLDPFVGIPIDKVAGLEARGFILGGAVAHQLSVGFVPVRKKGKLPGSTIEQDYTLEYGTATVEIHDLEWSVDRDDQIRIEVLELCDEVAGLRLRERFGSTRATCVCASSPSPSRPPASSVGTTSRATT